MPITPTETFVRNRKTLMAEKESRFSINKAGKFYVDENCIDCDLCREIAPNFFTRNDDEGHSYVYEQPKTAEDLELCMEALQDCPVEAIGDDGDE
jgi:ferredoxin